MLTSLSKISIFIFCLTMLCNTQQCTAQCTSWNIAITNVQHSTCAANGSFAVSLIGIDVPNLANIKYSIPVSSNGYVVQPNNSPNFASIPAGTYTVVVNTMCNGVAFSRSGVVNVQDLFTPIYLIDNSIIRPNCIGKGTIELHAFGGAPPYICNILSHPLLYSGSTSFTNSSPTFQIDSAIAGVYTYQMIDGCNNGTPIASVNVLQDSLQLYSSQVATYNAISCDSIYFSNMNVYANSNIPNSLITQTINVNNGEHQSGISVLNYDGYTFKLGVGKTIKDLYGKIATYKSYGPCGTYSEADVYISEPTAQLYGAINCNINGQIRLNISAYFACLPITYSLKNSTNQIVYASSISTPWLDTTFQNLPFDTYTVTFTTNDGYTNSSSYTIDSLGNLPLYDVSIIKNCTQKFGLHNKVQGFSVHQLATMLSDYTVELISSPPGYSFFKTTSPNYDMIVFNQASTSMDDSNYYFVEGTYVFKITNDCGVYYVTKNVTADDVYQFSISHTELLICNGMQIKQIASVTTNGQIVNNQCFYRNSLSGDFVYMPLGGANIYVPGKYYLYVTVYDALCDFGIWQLPGNFHLDRNFIYDSFIIAKTPLQVDFFKTQGYICNPINNGYGEIFISAINGIKFDSVIPYYLYYLSAQGNGINGPFITNNYTGVFTNFGASINDLYSIKIVDACYAFVVQDVKILDLSTAAYASSNGNIFCVGEQLQLYGLSLPNAIYNWTGPNGFTSNLQNPIINNVHAINSGVYSLVMTTSACPSTFSYTLQIYINPSPPIPILNIMCHDSFATISSMNIANCTYQWYKDGFLISGATSNIYNTRFRGNYQLVVTSNFNGCTSISDTLTMKRNIINLRPEIYCTDTSLCYGTIEMEVYYFVNNCTYQWYRNGILMPFKTNKILIVDSPGIYTCFVDAGLCSQYFTPPQVITKNIPIATIFASSDTVFCKGGSVQLIGNYSNGTIFAWTKDGFPVPNYTADSIVATQTGLYVLQVKNADCGIFSNTIYVSIIDSDYAYLSVSDSLVLCNGSSQTIYDSNSNNQVDFKWFYNQQLLANDTIHYLMADTQGWYTVQIKNPYCPAHRDSVFVQNIAWPDSTITVVSNLTVCEGEVVKLIIDNNTNWVYKWYKDNATISNINNELIVTESGNYYAEITNGYCTVVSNIISVEVIPKVYPTIFIKDTVAICEGDSLILTNTFFINATYTWLKNNDTVYSGTNNQYTIKSDGVYQLIVSTPTCRDSASKPMYIYYIAKPDASVTITGNNPLCQGDSVLLSAQYVAGITYTWLNSNTIIPNNTTNQLTVFNNGRYMLMASIGSCTDFSDAIQVTFIDTPKPEIVRLDMDIYTGFFATYNWYMNSVQSGVQRILPIIDTGYYQVQVSNIQGCKGWSDSLYINRKNDPCFIHIPNAFTPNGDGINDAFQVLAANQYEVYQFSIYNRWGNIVYSTISKKIDWDGTTNGITNEMGTYYYIFNYRCAVSTTKETRKGEIELIR